MIIILKVKIKKSYSEKLHEITTLTELGKDPKTFAFDLAKIFYRAIFDYKVYLALDLQGTEHSINFDQMLRNMMLLHWYFGTYFDLNIELC